MTPGEQAAREALEQSVAAGRVQVQLAGETINLLRNDIRAAVKEGIADAITDFQRQAAEKTGEMVGGAVLGLLKKASIFLMLGGLVYAIGGWSALAGLIKVLAGEK